LAEVSRRGRFFARMPLGESRFDVAHRAQRVIETLLQEEFFTGVSDFVIVAHGTKLFVWNAL
jgi:broad specificity phosphatase PhoE